VWRRVDKCRMELYHVDSVTSARHFVVSIRFPDIPKGNLAEYRIAFHCPSSSSGSFFKAKALSWNS